MNCFFVSDLHGRIDRYEKLFEAVIKEQPDALFMGGDLLPSYLRALTDRDLNHENFIRDFLVKKFNGIKEILGDIYPNVFSILGNDDGKMSETPMLEGEKQGLWNYCHNRCMQWADFTIYGYSCIPPSPFRLKDWERYDVTDYVRPGCIDPLDKMAAFTVPVSEHELKNATIEEDLKQLTGQNNLDRSIFLFHSPPHRSKLDRAALDGRLIDGMQVDVHVGSAAIRRFIEKRGPLVTLHGHIHESTRITGSWREKFDRTTAVNASHDGPELALVRFDPYRPEKAYRELL
ncbi:MAG: hypothetical protein GY950_35325 [bacterium]|nr:hypothetical protein [bacterium]